jgi:hypothetical protein
MMAMLRMFWFINLGDAFFCEKTKIVQGAFSVGKD